MTATGRVVVVTGASSGIGRATAIELSRRGSVVVMASRSESALLAAQQDCAPGMTTVVPTDVRHRHEVDALLDVAIRVHGRVDAVVHAAAALAYGRFEDVPAEVFDSALQTTLLGTANVARSALRVFEAQGGGTVSSSWAPCSARSPRPTAPPRTSPPNGGDGLVRCLQIEARTTSGIDISRATPGGVNTPVYLQAGTYLRRHGRPPPPARFCRQRVAATIVRKLARPPGPRDQRRARQFTHRARVPFPPRGFRPSRHSGDARRRPVAAGGAAHRGQRPPAQPSREAVRGTGTCSARRPGPPSGHG